VRFSPHRHPSSIDDVGDGRANDAADGGVGRVIVVVPVIVAVILVDLDRECRSGMIVSEQNCA